MNTLNILAWLLLAVPVAGAEDRLVAFPGAEGFGRFAQGGRGGKTLFVTNTRDYHPGREKPIPGSFRLACQTEGPRIVVFRVGGIIELKAPLQVTEPFLTIAGQTAPGDGICLKNYGLYVRNTHDVIIRHLRVRPGDSSGRELDAIGVSSSQNVIIDHCSASWSTDETLSVTGEGCTNVTVGWCLITESLNQSVHRKGQHGYGSLIRADGDITFHHNLYAHHKTRCPRPGTYGKPRGLHLDFRNNVIYDWIAPAGYSAADKVTMNYVGNYLKPGPSTKRRRSAFSVGGKATRLYVADNVLEGFHPPADDPGGSHGGSAKPLANDPWRLIANSHQAVQLDKPFAAPTISSPPAPKVFQRVLRGAGATVPRRDAVDRRIVQQVRTGQGQVINSQAAVGGWPEVRSGQAPVDSDQDGIPDSWERLHQLNGQLNGDAIRLAPSGYCWIEEYVNSLAAKASSAKSAKE